MPYWDIATGLTNWYLDLEDNNIVDLELLPSSSKLYRIVKRKIQAKMKFATVVGQIVLMKILKGFMVSMLTAVVIFKEWCPIYVFWILYFV